MSHYFILFYLYHHHIVYKSAQHYYLHNKQIMNHILECVDFFTTTNRAAVVGESLTAADYFMCVNSNHLLCMRKLL